MDPATLGALGQAGGDIASAAAGGPEIESETNNRIVNKGPNVKSKVGGGSIKVKGLKVGKGATLVLNLGEPPPAIDAPEGAAAASSGSSRWTVVAIVAIVVLLLVILARKFL